LFTFPSSTYKLLPSPRRFPAILLTSITVAWTRCLISNPGIRPLLAPLSTRITVPSGDRGLGYRSSITACHPGGVLPNSFTRGYARRLIHALRHQHVRDQGSAKPRLPAPRLTLGFLSSSPFRLYLLRAPAVALLFVSYRLHAEMPRSWPFATVSEPGKHLASCVGRHSHLGRAIWTLMVWNGNPAFGAEGL